jgi:predicted ester cyclase
VKENPVSKDNKALVRRFVEEAFYEGHTTVEGSIAEGDRVVCRWIFHGTHRGELMGLGPTEKQVTITAYRISGGKFEEVWNNFDRLGMLQQLGAAPGR